MLTKLKTKFQNRVQEISKNNQLYIVPTFDGLKLVGLNFILLVMGLIYANNYVLLFNFILFCFFLGSMFYTHFNLYGLKLISAKLGPLHAGGHGLLSLNFKTTSSLGHYFLGLKLRNNLVDLQNKSFTFSIDPKNQKSFTVDIPVQGQKRGQLKLTKLYIETFFPFHLFRCFVYFKPDLVITVYPAKTESKAHQILSSLKERREEGEDFELSDFKTGDSLKRVHWKKLAQTGKWYSRKMISPTYAPVMLTFSENDLSKIEIEKELSSICTTLYELQFQNISYGLTLGSQVILPDCSFQHLNRCLRALAEYEN